MRIYDFNELFDKSDLVVIATPTTKTTDTGEMTNFTASATLYPDGHVTDNPAAGVQTTFKAIKVIKGNQEIKQFTLHHYRLAERPEPPSTPGTVAVGPGPLTVWFAPSRGCSDEYECRHHGAFLMFLTVEKDGRYAPYGDNTDPDGRSVISLGSTDLP